MFELKKKKESIDVRKVRSHFSIVELKYIRDDCSELLEAFKNVAKQVETVQPKVSLLYSMGESQPFIDSRERLSKSLNGVLKKGNALQVALGSDDKSIPYRRVIEDLKIGTNDSIKDTKDFMKKCVNEGDFYFLLGFLNEITKLLSSIGTKLEPYDYDSNFGNILVQNENSYWMI